MTNIHFPTDLHRHATDIVRSFLLQQQHIDTILLVNSCARGKATPESDIDISVLMAQTTGQTEIKLLEGKWQSLLRTDPLLTEYKNSHRFAQIHLDIVNGVFTPSTWDDGGGPDFFEIEIGNLLVYSAVLADEGEHFKELKRNWLPYYDTALQMQRMKMIREACAYDLDHIPFFIKRGLHFQAFDRLYKGFQEFLQVLFIKHKTYPIAYNKWIRDQVQEILNLPELYRQLSPVISIRNIESDEVNDKALTLKALLDQYC